jgi:hypothetical protein
MYSYSQATGILTRNGATAGQGYSGHGAGRNNPAMQATRDVGPIPQGQYKIGPPFDTPSTAQGPHVMRLTPVAGTNTFGRDGFLMHGDDPQHDASEGCIIMPPGVRDAVSASGDTDLTVTA